MGDMPSPAQTVAYLSNQQQPQQGYYPPQQGGYQPPQQGGYYPPQQGGYQQGGYQPPQQGGYYPPQQGGYPPQRSAYTFSHEDKAIAQGLMGNFKSVFMISLGGCGIGCLILIIGVVMLLFAPTIGGILILSSFCVCTCGIIAGMISYCAGTKRLMDDHLLK